MMYAPLRLISHTLKKNKTLSFILSSLTLSKKHNINKSKHLVRKLYFIEHYNFIAFTSDIYKLIII